MSNHSTAGYDLRGSSHDRRARRAWLIQRYGLHCYHCGDPITDRSMEVDRFPLCGHAGGTYRRDNIVPSCRYCNVNRCETCRGAIKARGGLLERQTSLPFGQDPWPEEEP